MKTVSLQAPQLPFISNVTGRWITEVEATDPDYWVKHLRQTVRFADGLEQILAEPEQILLEVGPGKTLSTFAIQHPEKSAEQVVLSSLRHPKDKQADMVFLLTTLSKLWLSGGRVDWSSFYADEKRRRLPLPTYPFERQRYWIEALKSLETRSTPQVFPGKKESSSYSRRSSSNSYALSKDEVEQMLASIWQELLGIGRVGRQNNFFELGGDSLLAITLFSQIQKKINKKLPLAALFQAPTIEKLASLLRDREQSPLWTSLVGIQIGGSRRPFFCVHGAGGHVLNYYSLSRYLGSEQPFYALQAQGLDGKLLFHTNIEEMAAHYIKEMRELQPEGPYFLGGYCGGGMIAFEMAQQLHAQDQQVALLALFNTYNWSKIQLPNSFPDTVKFMLKDIECHKRNLLLLEPKEQLIFLKERAKWAQRRFMTRIRASRDMSSLVSLRQLHDRLVIKYLPQVYSGRLTLFQTLKLNGSDQNIQIGWEGLATGGIEVQEAPTYFRGMLVEPFVKNLAAQLRTCIERAEEE